MRSALILAGGASSRFGRPKALVDFRGRPMIARVAEAVSARADELLVSVAEQSPARDIVRILPHARVVHDAQTGRGPIEGIARAFEAAHGDIVLVAPCDAPLLRPQLFDALIDALGDQEASVPRLDVFDPVRAVYRRDAVRRVLSLGDVPSPSALVDRLRAVFVEEDALRRADPELVSFIDVNAEEDLRRASAARA